jgi:hypothetical protein
MLATAARPPQQAWVNGCDVPVSARGGGGGGSTGTNTAAAAVKRETLRNITKRLYNSARTNLFTGDIVRVFRYEVGACPQSSAAVVPPRPHHHNQTSW